MTSLQNSSLTRQQSKYAWLCRPGATRLNIKSSDCEFEKGAPLMLVISGCIQTACSMCPYSLNWRTITWSWWQIFFLKSESGSKSSRWLDESCSPFAPCGHQTGWDVPLNHYVPEEVLSSIFFMKKQNQVLGCLFWMLFLYSNIRMKKKLPTVLTMLSVSFLIL